MALAGFTAVAFGLTGCAETASRIRVTPDDAEIYVDGTYAGKGEAQIVNGRTSQRARDLAIVVRRPGYQTYEATLHTSSDEGQRGVSFFFGSLYMTFGAGLMIGGASAPAKDKAPLFLLGSLMSGLAYMFFAPAEDKKNFHRFDEAYTFHLQRETPKPVVAPTPSPTPTPFTSEVDLPVDPPAPARPDDLALVIGVERYGAGLPAAPHAERDAAAVRLNVQGALGVPAANIVTLVDRQATLGGIRAALEGQLRERVVHGKSRVYVYFAGHGVRDAGNKVAYLVPHDGNVKYPASTCYPLPDLVRAMGELGASGAIALLDTSFSGVNGRTAPPTVVGNDLRAPTSQPHLATMPKGVSVLVASRPNELNAVLAAEQHGLFTFHVLRALRGALATERALTLPALGAFVGREVGQAARAADREQTPVLLGSPQAGWSVGGRAATPKP